MISRGDLFDALQPTREYGCPRKCSKCRRGGSCATVNDRLYRVDRDAKLLTLLLDLRDLIAEATLVRTLIVDQLVAEGWRSPPLSDEEIERRMAKRRAERAGTK